jgi:ribosomal protein S14
MTNVFRLNKLNRERERRRQERWLRDAHRAHAVQTALQLAEIQLRNLADDQRILGDEVRSYAAQGAADARKALDQIFAGGSDAQ